MNRSCPGLSCDPNLIGFFRSSVSMTTRRDSCHSPSFPCQLRSSSRTSFTNSGLNSFRNPSFFIPLKRTPLLQSIVNSVRPASNDKKAPVNARPIKINGVRKSHKPIRPNTVTGLPFMIGSGKKLGVQRCIRCKLALNANTTKKETIPFQKSMKGKSDSAPLMDRCVAPTTTAVPLLSYHVPAGARLKSICPNASFADNSEMLERRLQRRQKIIFPDSSTSKFGISRSHFGQVIATVLFY